MSVQGLQRTSFGLGRGVGLTVCLTMASGLAAAGSYGPMAEDLLWRPRSAGPSAVLWVWHAGFVMILVLNGIGLARAWKGFGAVESMVRMVGMVVIAGVWLGGAWLLGEFQQVMSEPPLPEGWDR